MREIWTADSETDPFKYGRIPKPFIWGAYTVGQYHEFKTVDEFVNFFIDKPVIVYAHNGGKFDWFFLLEHLEAFEPIMVIGGRLSKFKIGACEFRDSINILPIALRDFKKDDFDYTILEESERNKPENYKKIQAYLKNDCQYLYDVVNQFVDEYGMQLTVAGSALKVWSKMTGEKAPQTSGLFYQEIAPYYYGGRVEVFKGGLINEPFTVIDINSAYPFAMKHAHPYGENFSISDQLPKTDKVLQRAFIRLTAKSTGAFPFRTKSGLHFPADNIVREFFISGWEYIAARKTGTLFIGEIISCITFPDVIRFDDYIDHFFQKKSDCKKSGDKAGYIFAKLFLNSLYGKFGANPEKYSEYTVIPPRYIEAAETDGYGFCAELDKWALVSKPLEEEKQRYYNVAVAASITGFVRAYMWESINKCSGVRYCDTDSIVCTDSGKLKLDPVELGAWDIEARGNFGGIAGKKLYALQSDNGDWKTASKGVRLTPAEIMRVANGHMVEYKPDAPSFSLKRGINFNSRKVVATI